MSIECISLNTINILYFIHYPSRCTDLTLHFTFFHSRLLDLSLVWFKQHSSTSESTVPSGEKDDANRVKTSDTGDIFRDGCKTIVSILVILTNDCGKNLHFHLMISVRCFSETHCDHLTSDDRFFANLFRLLVTMQQSSLANEDKFDTIALVCYSFSFVSKLQLSFQALNLLINLVQNTKHVYKRLMEDNMPGGSTKKIYEYLANVSDLFESNSHDQTGSFSYFVNKNHWQQKRNLKKRMIGWWKMVKVIWMNV